MKVKGLVQVERNQKICSHGLKAKITHHNVTVVNVNDIKHDSYSLSELPFYI